MPKNTPYPEEFRRKMVELVRASRSGERLAREFEPSAQAIRNRAQQADLDSGRRDDGLTSNERDGLQRLRRENRRLKAVSITHQICTRISSPRYILSPGFTLNAL